jgi:carbamoyl-phosphate synthase small subunit
LSMDALLALESGLTFKGKAFGCSGEAQGEVIFNTSMTGYQEILTDPSYRGQLVCMTYPLIGNYGINKEDVESLKIFLSGFIIKELSRIPSSWRASGSLDDYLKEKNILGIQGLDTRALTLHLRDQGAKRGIISTTDLDPQSLIKRAKRIPSLVGRDLVKEVTQEASDWNKKGVHRVVVLDLGIKWNILRELEGRNCRIKILPAHASSEEILSHKPHGLFLSNGPGDPDAVKYLVATVKSLIGRLPIFGICLGHQILGLALGAKTFKLKFGHHGGNHPVKDLKTGRVAITAQNHGFAVDPESLGTDVRVTHVNLNDGTCEGMEHKKLPIFSVQYHPESCPGPHDSTYLFDKFVRLLCQSSIGSQ